MCDRGVSARADKAKEVKRAGGIGMLLFNVPDGATDVMTEILSVPHVHLKADSREALRNYAATAGASVKLMPSVTANNALAPQMASFSSRGPTQAARGAHLTGWLANGMHFYKGCLASRPMCLASITNVLDMGHASCFFVQTHYRHACSAHCSYGDKWL